VVLLPNIPSRVINPPISKKGGSSHCTKMMFSLVLFLYFSIDGAVAVPIRDLVHQGKLFDGLHMSSPVTLLQEAPSATNPPTSPWTVFELSTSASNGITYSLGSLGIIAGLYLLVVGVGKLAISLALFLGISIGMMTFALLYFANNLVVGNTSDLSYIISIITGVIVGLLIVLGVISMDHSKIGRQFYVLPLLGIFLGFILGIMFNTIVMYHGIETPCWAFLTSVLLFTIIGFLTWFIVSSRQFISVAHLFIGAFSMSGSYILVWSCGGISGTYPNQFGNLRNDSLATSWQYYVMFACTFIVALLAMVFQHFTWSKVKIPFDDSSDNELQNNEWEHPRHASIRKEYPIYSDAGNEYFGRSAVPPPMPHYNSEIKF